MIDKKSAEIKDLFAQASKEEIAALNDLYKMDVAQLLPDDFAVITAKLSMDKGWRASLNGIGPVGGDLRRAGNGLAQYLDGQVEAPTGPKERAFLRKVFKRALDRLNSDQGSGRSLRLMRNELLTMSDLQALLWYPERRLYDTAKSKEGVVRGYDSDETPDYANAARALVERKLGRPAKTPRRSPAPEAAGTESEISRGDAGVSGLGSAGRDGRAGGRASDDGQQLRSVEADDDGGITLLQSERPPIFISGLLKAVENIKQPKAPAKQWMGILRKTAGVRAEEVEFMGLEQWLNSQSESIPKADVLHSIMANQFEVTDTDFGEA
jgi:hypothetical protein